jgi:hypothetical protein
MSFQIRLRAILLAGGLFLLLVALFLSFQGIMPFLDYHWWKIQHTWAHLNALEAATGENARTWAGLTIPLFFGFPTVFSLLGAIFIWGVWPGIPAIILSQILCSVGTMVLTSLRLALSRKPDQTRELVAGSGVRSSHLAFFPRLFLSVPTRVSDAMIASGHTSSDSWVGTLMGSILGLALRITIQGLWAKSLIHLVINFLPVAEVEIAAFMASSAVLVFMYIWPRIPELLPQRDTLGELFLDLTGERTLSSLPPRRPTGSSAGPA